MIPAKSTSPVSNLGKSWLKGNTNINRVCMVVSDSILFEDDKRTTRGVQISNMCCSNHTTHREWLKNLNITEKGVNAGLVTGNLTHVAPSGKMTLTSAWSTDALGTGVQKGTPSMYLPVLASYFTESPRGESQPKVKL